MSAEILTVSENYPVIRIYVHEIEIIEHERLYLSATDCTSNAMDNRVCMYPHQEHTFRSVC